jgi:hypothetical protein
MWQMDDTDNQESKIKGRFKVKNVRIVVAIYTLFSCSVQVKVGEDVDDVNKTAIPVQATNPEVTSAVVAEAVADTAEVIGRFRVKNVVVR